MLNSLRPQALAILAGLLALGALAAVTPACSGTGVGFASTIPCTSDDDCLPGQWCDVDKELCVGVPELDAAADTSADGTDSTNGDCVSNEDCWPLEDGDFCNGFLMCKDGACVPDPSTVVTCPPSVPCAPNVCNPDTGYCEAQPIPGCGIDECTTNSECPSTGPCDAPVCVNGLCQGTPLSCNDGDPCTDDFCDAASGGCQYVFNPNIPGCSEPGECEFAWQCPIGGNGGPAPPTGLCSYWDCVDGACVELTTATQEVCNDGQDNDCDGLTDCADGDCADSVSCGTCASNPIPLQCNKWTSVQGLWAGAGIDKYACVGETMTGGEIAFSFSLPYAATVFISGFSEPFENAWFMTLAGDCSGDACIDAVTMPDLAQDGTGAYPLQVIANTPYYFAIDQTDGQPTYFAEVYVECPVQEQCQDFLDNDGDGLEDCADPDCDGIAPCQDVETNCTDGIDNDGDGATDCVDGSCASDPFCSNTQSCGDLPIIGLACNTGFEVPALPADLPSFMSTYPCADGTYNGSEWVFSFTAPQNGEIAFWAKSFDGQGVPTMLLDSSCVSTACVAAELSGDGLYAEVTGGKEYFLVAENAASLASIFLECGDDPPPVQEVCFDGIDNDNDGLTDCKDLDCKGSPFCTTGGECTPAAEIGCGQQIFEPIPTDSFEIEDYSCFPFESFPGGETAFQFTPTQDGMINLFGFGDPPSAMWFLLEGSCTGDACIASSGEPFAFEPLIAEVKAGQTYFLVYDSIEPFPTVVFDAYLECAGPPPPEECFDGFDNDGDGAIDCADSECVNVSPCQASETNCTDGFDNDGDFKVDCQEQWCQDNSPACDDIPPQQCSIAGYLQCFEGWWEPVQVPSGVLDSYDCLDGFFPGNETVFQFTAQTDGTIQWYGFGEPWGTTMSFLLESACDGGNCIAAAQAEFEPLNAAVQAGKTYYLVIDSMQPVDTFVFDSYLECWAPEVCGDGIDNDNDGSTDCGDSECQDEFPCQSFETNCVDGVDNDGDGETDCQEVWCKANAPDVCSFNEICGDGVDNDGDGFADCQDAECVGVANCPAQSCGPTQVGMSCNDQVWDMPWGGEGYIDAYSCSEEQMPGGEQVFYLGTGLSGPVVWQAWSEFQAASRAMLMTNSCDSNSCQQIAYGNFEGQLNLQFFADPNTEYWIVVDNLSPWETYVWEATLTCI